MCHFKDFWIVICNTKDMEITDIRAEKYIYASKNAYDFL